MAGVLSLVATADGRDHGRCGSGRDHGRWIQGYLAHTAATMAGGYKGTSLKRSQPWQVCAQRGDLLLKDAAILHYWAEKVRSPER